MREIPEDVMRESVHHADRSKMSIKIKPGEMYKQDIGASDSESVVMGSDRASNAVQLQKNLNGG